MPLAALAGWSGASIGAATVLAQVLRVRRRGTDGVNATTWSLFTLMSAFWLSYGVAERSGEVIVGTLLGLPFLVWLLSMLDADERRAGLGRGAAAIFATTWLPAALFGWNAGLLGIGVLMVGTRLPQLLELAAADHARGVSTWSWVLGSGSVTLWLGYYVGSQMTAAAVSMGLALVTNLTIVVLASLRHREGRRSEPVLVAA